MFKKNPPDFVIKNIMDLHAERVARYLTTDEVCEATGVSKTCLRGYERGFDWPSVRNYNRLARFLGWQLWDGGKK